MTQFGDFRNLCRDSTLPVCNLFLNRENYSPQDSNKCQLVGFTSGGHQVRNIGTIILCGFAVFVSLYLLWRSERKQAAVGRREMQLFLVAYIVLSVAEIFTVGGIIDKHHKLLVWFSAVHIGMVTAACWILLLNAIVGYQLLDDGTWLSMGLVLASALIFFTGTGYIALDTAFGWTSAFTPNDNWRNYALYVLYLLFPLVLLVGYFILESVLVLHVLGETKPMLLLGGAALFFAIGQVFDFVISVHLCNVTHGKINGALFETLFTLLAVTTLWIFWSSITEDVWMDEPLNPSMSDAAYSETQTRPYVNGQYGA